MKLIGVIPAAGKSSRMGKPKHLLKHRGKLLIYHVLDQMVKTRVDGIIIVHNGDKLPDMIGDSYLGVKIKYVEQKKQNGIGNAVRLCKSKVGFANMLIILGDIYYDGDLNQMRHQFVTGEDVVSFGVVRVKNKNEIKESYGISGKTLIEKPQNVTNVRALLGMGVYFTEPIFFDVLEECAKENPELGITEAIDKIDHHYRMPYILEGKYENVNYRKQLK